MFNVFLSLDKQLTTLINQIFPRNLFFDYLFSFFSGQGQSILIWIIIILAVIIAEEIRHPGIQKTDKIFIVYFFISFLTTAFIVNIVLKNLIQRPRPPISNQLSTISACPTDFSFPSGHASTSFAAATILVFFDKKRKWFYYTIAILISLSRIYLNCHFFFDVLFGAIIGYLISKTYLFLLPKIFKNS